MALQKLSKAGGKTEYIKVKGQYFKVLSERNLEISNGGAVRFGSIFT